MLAVARCCDGQLAQVKACMNIFSSLHQPNVIRFAT
jgi:hypothetical protein